MEMYIWCDKQVISPGNHMILGVETSWFILNHLRVQTKCVDGYIWASTSSVSQWNPSKFSTTASRFPTMHLCRKLHCMRNNIHMNLFGSFILRALSILIKDALLDQMNSVQSGPHHYQGQRWVDMQVLMFHSVVMCNTNLVVIVFV